MYIYIHINFSQKCRFVYIYFGIFSLETMHLYGPVEHGAYCHMVQHIKMPYPGMGCPHLGKMYINLGQIDISLLTK